MNKQKQKGVSIVLILIIIAGVGLLSVLGVLGYTGYQKWILNKQEESLSQQGVEQPEQREQPDQPEATSSLTIMPFIPLGSPLSPSFIQSLNNTEDVKISLHYEGTYEGSGWASTPEFYTPEGSDEQFLPLSKIKDRKERGYAYGPDYYSIFTSRESHAYQGSPIYLLNEDAEYSVSYIGLKISDSELISELKIEFGIDYISRYYEYEDSNEPLGRSEESFLSKIFGIKSVYACGPGLYLRLIGDSKLIFIQESDGIVWYRLENPINLYDLELSYCTAPSEPMPDYCSPKEYGPMYGDPVECWDYCYYNSSISSLEDGNLRMHIFYKPNDKEGFLGIQVANLILTDSAGKYYQPTIGKYFEDYYCAYLQ